MVSVFLSHSSHDKPFVRELSGMLREKDLIEVWFDETDIGFGENIVTRVKEGLDSEFVLFILSENSVNSKWVEAEWTDAFWDEMESRRTKLAVVVYGDCPVPRLLRTKKYFDLRKNQPEGMRQIRTWLLGQRPSIPTTNNLEPHQPQFVGREEVLEDLRKRLREPGAVVHLQGMPGLGKTATAREFARRHGPDFDGVYWLPCHDGSLIQQATELARQLGLSFDGELEQTVREVRQWCARKRCLLVLDNVESEEAGRLIPGGQASVLVTTRLDNLKFLRLRNPAPLPLFTEEQCFELFGKAVGEAAVTRHTAECKALFKRIGYVPIGVSVAAGLVRHDVRHTIPHLAKNLPADVFELIADAIDELSAEARRLLAAMSSCAPQGFRMELAAKVAGMSETETLEALHVLVSRSLVEELDRDERRYALHSLVREAGGGGAYASRHAKAILEEFERWETDWRLCKIDLADFQVASSWAIGEVTDENSKYFANSLAYYGYELTRRIGQLAEAFEITERMQSIGTGPRQSEEQQKIWLGNQALILHNWGRLEEAMALHQKEESICLELGDRAGLQRSYGNQAVILKAWGRLEEAMALHQKKESICLELGDRAGLQRSYGNQAVIFQAWGRLEEAMALHQKEESICLELGDRAGLQASYGNQAVILLSWGRLEEAMALHQKKESICLELGDRAGLARSHANQAVIFKAWGRLEEALERANNALVTFQELKMPRETETVKNIVAGIQRALQSKLG